MFVDIISYPCGLIGTHISDNSELLLYARQAKTTLQWHGKIDSSPSRYKQHTEDSIVILLTRSRTNSRYVPGHHAILPRERSTDLV